MSQQERGKENGLLTTSQHQHDPIRSVCCLAGYHITLSRWRMVRLLPPRELPPCLANRGAAAAAGNILIRSLLISCLGRRCLIPGLAVSPRSPPYPSARLLCGTSQMETEQFNFGPYKIHPSEVFYATKLSYAMVNLRPLLPGHVLVCPRRDVKRFVDLSADETSDLWLSAKEVGDKLEHHHKASSLTFTIQDGLQAGQTVPHVHIHIIPRRSSDFEKNDEIYAAIDEKEKQLKEKLELDIDRKDRTYEEMAREADEYRVLFS